MNIKVTTILLSATFAVSSLNAENYICFTVNQPAADPQIEFLGDREVYIDKNGDDHSVEIIQGQSTTGIIGCYVQPFFGIGVSLKCGRESISLDLPNYTGTIKRDGSYASQNLVCRERAQIKL